MSRRDPNEKEYIAEHVSTVTTSTAADLGATGVAYAALLATSARTHDITHTSHSTHHMSTDHTVGTGTSHLEKTVLREPVNVVHTQVDRVTAIPITETQVHAETQHYLHTQMRTPVVESHPPVLPAHTDVAGSILNNAAFSSSAHISTSAVNAGQLPVDAAERARQEEHFRREADRIALQHQRAIDEKAEAYRRDTEAQAEKIRQELEKQHLRDVQFRQELVDDAITRQKREVQLEAQAVMADLELERRRAHEALERSKMATDINVNIDTLAGSTVAGGTTVLEKTEVQTGVVYQKTPVGTTTHVEYAGDAGVRRDTTSNVHATEVHRGSTAGYVANRDLDTASISTTDSDVDEHKKRGLIGKIKDSLMK